MEEGNIAYLLCCTNHFRSSLLCRSMTFSTKEATFKTSYDKGFGSTNMSME